MTEKDRRRAAIRAILDEHRGSTQEKIKALLESCDIHASQSTLSRDLREMGAVKIPVERGGARYMLGGGEHGKRALGEIGQALRSFSVEYEPVGNFLVIKTTPGNAPALCVVLDRQRWPEIVGTIAGDDTILVIARTAADIESVMEKLNTSVEEGTA
jgi:transcriptional regulator of arginine metabolism